MCDRFIEWEKSILQYCMDNNLSFEKAKKAAKCSNKDMLVLQHYDPHESSGLGLLDETLLPVILWIYRDGDGVRFEQTENTQKYLGG